MQINKGLVQFCQWNKYYWQPQDEGFVRLWQSRNDRDGGGPGNRWRSCFCWRLSSATLACAASRLWTPLISVSQQDCIGKPVPQSPTGIMDFWISCLNCSVIRSQQVVHRGFALEETKYPCDAHDWWSITDLPGQKASYSGYQLGAAQNRWSLDHPSWIQRLTWVFCWGNFSEDLTIFLYSVQLSDP